MKKILWILTIVGSIIGVLVLLLALTTSQGAPQEAAGAAIAVAFSVIPYCIARAVSELGNKGDS